MQSVVSTAEHRHEHPPQSVSQPTQRPVRRVGVVDRLALRLGLALVMWGRRPVPARTERRARLAELDYVYRAQMARENAQRDLRARTTAPLQRLY